MTIYRPMYSHSICSRKGCARQTFLDTNRCFEHQGTRLVKGFGAWFAFCAFMGLVMTGVTIWAIVELVLWVKTK